ncbi:RNA polymerase sigma factor [Butyricicoccus sp.]|uniref:RNA polymerase sigma factor n=1 Tax=Butyricicoccus sp. TaxID=2049021 RepID=UPI003F13FA0E
MKNRESQFDEVYKKYARTVYRIAYQYTLNQHTAEDIMQDVFVKYLTCPTIFLSKEREHEKAWFIRVTINACKDFLKSKAHQAVMLNDTLAATDDLPNRELAADLEAELKKLSEEERTMIYLYYYEQYTTAEIARMMKLNENTVRSKLYRARNKLRLEREGG